jgi:hypothetical protein
MTACDFINGITMKSVSTLVACCMVVLGMHVSSFAQTQDVQPFVQDQEAAFEQPPVLVASQILRPEFLRGSEFAVREGVPTYAGHNQYVIDSSFGVFEATGNQELVEQVAAIRAIARLDAVSRTDEYTKALKRAAQSPVEFVGNLAKDPVGTVSGVPKGIWKIINRAGDSIKNLGEQRERNPYEDGMGRNLIGFSKAKREIAKQLRVDPYSSNEVLQKQLNGIAWAAFGGNATFSAALMPVGGAAGSAITAVNVADATSDAVYDTAPDDLRRANLERLMEIGVRAEAADAFLSSPSYSPTRATALVNSLSLLKGVAGLTEYVTFATRAEDEVDAIFYQRTARLIAKIHGETPLLEISFALGLPVCLASDGTAIVALEWDYVAWTRAAAQFAEALKSSPSGETPIRAYRLSVTGAVSPMARANLEQLGIETVDRALPGPLKTDEAKKDETMTD